MGYIGNEPTTGHFPVDNFTSTGGSTYTLSKVPASAGAIEVSVSGVLQPTTAYSVSGTTLTMAGVATGVPIFIRHLGETLSLPTPADGSVTDAKLAAGAVTDAKIVGMASSKLTGALPAIDGSALTGITHTPANNSVGLAQLAGGTDGQIISYDASGDPVAVGPGTSGQVLTSAGAGAPPTFAAAAAGGAWNVIKSTSISSVATVNFVHGTGGVVIDSTYEKYILVGSHVILNTAGGISVRLSSDAGSSWYSSSNYDHTSETWSTGTYVGAVAASANQFDITVGVEAATGHPTCFTVEFYNLSQSTNHKPIQSRTQCIKGSGQSQGSMSFGSFKANNAINGIQVLADGGAPTLVSGRLTLYGIAHA